MWFQVSAANEIFILLAFYAAYAGNKLPIHAV
jgi:hypothetical protein